jgi:hypothetical protein
VAHDEPPPESQHGNGAEPIKGNRASTHETEARTEGADGVGDVQSPADAAAARETESEDAVIARLATLSELDYLRQRKAAAEQLGITSLPALDKTVRAARTRAQQAAQAQAREARAAEQDTKKLAREAERRAKQLARDAEQEAKKEAKEAEREAGVEQHDGFVILDQEKPRFVNVLALVKHIKATPAWHDALRHNEFTGDYEISGSFPPDGGPKDVVRPFEDPKDTLLATLYFQANGFARASKTTSFDAIAHVALEHSYHPVRDYLNQLRWDGTERVRLLFQKYFSAEVPEDQPERDGHVAYLEHISTCFAVGAVARIMQPGCKHDHVPVIVDPSQGTGKSLGLRELCPDPTWFTDNIPANLQDKDTKDAMNGKWIVELSETPHVAKAVEQLKAFVSSQVDRYRPAYGRTTKDHPRQVAFIGTANQLEFIDVTGNRRFWPFTSAELIDVEGIARDRDQLWAEAVKLYRDGVHWCLPPTIEAIAREKQEAFQKPDVWDEVIGGWIGGWIAKRGGSPFTMADLFAQGTGIAPFRETVCTETADEMRAGRCLVRLGFFKKRYTLNGKRAVWWQRCP